MSRQPLSPGLYGMRPAATSRLVRRPGQRDAAPGGEAADTVVEQVHRAPVTSRR
ncbi:hypothetical protein J2Z21_005222 [Streptomyces griseochromogenes]|uniref:Uncharacterized protein n=1 Tax=Streptomyces griseochromogenes TaxID=68214 RepID=A0ABS4LXU9_9ACTN|nr:hypothetical protein [Streptomyces griseochromogenes]MBP2052240.1 hypothetical protein [Streptomyces griseochromogenes]